MRDNKRGHTGGGVSKIPAFHKLGISCRVLQVSDATQPDKLSRLSDEEILGRLLSAYHKQKECQRKALFGQAQKAYEDAQRYRQEALSRMRRLDPVLRGGKHGV